jgi:hypothetical protein
MGETRALMADRIQARAIRRCGVLAAHQKLLGR